MTSTNRSALGRNFPLAALAAEMSLGKPLTNEQDLPIVSTLDPETLTSKHYTMRVLTKEVNGMRSENAEWQGWNPQYSKPLHEMEDEHLANALSSVNARMSAFDQQGVLFPAVYPDGRAASEWGELMSDELNYRYATHLLSVVRESIRSIEQYQLGSLSDNTFRALRVRHESSVKELIHCIEEVKSAKEPFPIESGPSEMLQGSMFQIPELRSVLELFGIDDLLSEDMAARFKAASIDPAMGGSSKSGVSRQQQLSAWLASLAKGSDVSGNQNIRLTKEDLDRATAAYGDKEAAPAHENNDPTDHDDQKEQVEQQQNQRGVPRFTNEDALNNDPRI